MAKKEKIKVHFLQRKASVHAFSAEFIFNDVRQRLKHLIDSKVFISKYTSSGLFKRLYITIEAFFHQGEVNHITGDVHFLATFLKKRKTVLTVLDCIFMQRSSGIARWIFQYFWLKIPVAKSRFVTAISEATKQDIIKYTNCDPNKVIVIPVAVNTLFQPHPKPFNKKKPVLLHIGLAENKNLMRLMEAIKDIDCHLSIIGKLREEHVKELEARGIDYSYAYHISNEEMVQKYVECDILAFASTFEGFGMPIIEANYIERPVITGNVTSMPWVAGDSACLVDPFDVASIKDGILKIINDDAYREQLVAKGRVNRERFDPDRIAMMYYDLYQKIQQD